MPPADRRRDWWPADWGLVIAALGLSLVGAALVWSATRHTAGSSYLLKHLVNTGIGVGCFVLVARVDQRTLRAWTPWVYGVSVTGLVLVLSPVGSTVNGSRSWIQLPGGFSVQPSEFVKVALSLALATIFAERLDRGLRPSRGDLAWGGAVVAVPVGLVLLQPDLGSALVILAMACGVVAVAGAPKWLLALVAGAGAAAAVAAFTTPVLSGYQRARLTAFLDPSADPEGIGYQTRMVRAAVGGGGWWGQGLFHGAQTQAGVIPFQQTDFVFSVAGEELGLVGSAGVVVLVGFVVVRVLLVGSRSDPFGQLACTGVAVWFAVQSLENIGMNLGITPVTGLPLPLVSYGGSSMFAAWLALGVVSSVHRTPVSRGRRSAV